jgi:hypothetical protein
LDAGRITRGAPSEGRGLIPPASRAPAGSVTKVKGQVKIKGKVKGQVKIKVKGQVKIKVKGQVKIKVS